MQSFVEDKEKVSTELIITKTEKTSKNLNIVRFATDHLVRKRE